MLCMHCGRCKVACKYGLWLLRRTPALSKLPFLARIVWLRDSNSKHLSFFFATCPGEKLSRIAAISCGIIRPG